MNGQLALRNPNPEVGDAFRFTWWNTREGAAVSVEHWGRWREGVIAARGGRYVEVAIASAGARRKSVRKLYSVLRRMR